MGFQNFLMLDGYQRRALDMFRNQNGMLVDGYDERIPRILEDTLVATHQYTGMEISGTYDMGMENYSSLSQTIVWDMLLDITYAIQLEEEHIKILKRVSLAMVHMASIRSLYTRTVRWENIIKRLDEWVDGMHYVISAHVDVRKMMPMTYKATMDEARAMLFAISWASWEAEEDENMEWVAEYDSLLAYIHQAMPIPTKAFANFKNY